MHQLKYNYLVFAICTLYFLFSLRLPTVYVRVYEYNLQCFAPTVGAWYFAHTTYSYGYGVRTTVIVRYTI